MTSSIGKQLAKMVVIGGLKLVFDNYWTVGLPISGKYI